MSYGLLMERYKCEFFHKIGIMVSRWYDYIIRPHQDRSQCSQSESCQPVVLLIGIKIWYVISRLDSRGCIQKDGRAIYYGPWSISFYLINGSFWEKLNQKNKLSEEV